MSSRGSDLGGDDAPRVLFVDDERNVLEAIRRQLRRRYDLAVATSGREGLERIASDGPFAVIVSDMRMPEMDGAAFLSAARERSPHSVRVMLTGNADQETAAQAVNQGHVFRFLTKPCDQETLVATVEACLEQHRLLRAETELLERTLKGSVKVLIDTLSLVNPAAFGRATRVRAVVRRLAEGCAVERAWEVEVAAMLSQVGCVAIPEDVLRRSARGEPLTEAERKMLREHPRTAHDLIRNIPRLGGVAEAILYQQTRFDGRGYPGDGRAGRDLPIAARILKVALDYDLLVGRGRTHKSAIHVLIEQVGAYDPEVLAALGERSVAGAACPAHERIVTLSALKPGMVIAEDVCAASGAILISMGHEVTPTLLHRLHNFMDATGLERQIRVWPPVEPEPAPRARRPEARRATR